MQIMFFYGLATPSRAKTSSHGDKSNLWTGACPSFAYIRQLGAGRRFRMGTHGVGQTSRMGCPRRGIGSVALGKQAKGHPGCRLRTTEGSRKDLRVGRRSAPEKHRSLPQHLPFKSPWSCSSRWMSARRSGGDSFEVEQLVGSKGLALGDMPEPLDELAHELDDGLTPERPRAAGLAVVPAAHRGVAGDQAQGGEVEVEARHAAAALGDLELSLVLAAAAFG